MTNKQKKIHIKKGDTVKIITGDEKGKTGEIIKVISKTQQVIIQNINLKTKHLRPKQENEAGKIIQIEAPIHSSNVMLYNNNSKTASKYEYKIKKNNKQKVLKKEEIIQSNNYE